MTWSWFSQPINWISAEHWRRRVIKYLLTSGLPGLDHLIWRCIELCYVDIVLLDYFACCNVCPILNTFIAWARVSIVSLHSLLVELHAQWGLVFALSSSPIVQIDHIVPRCQVSARGFGFGWILWRGVIATWLQGAWGRTLNVAIGPL